MTLPQKKSAFLGMDEDVTPTQTLQKPLEPISSFSPVDVNNLVEASVSDKEEERRRKREQLALLREQKKAALAAKKNLK
jgi:hypothetical protein